MKPELHPKPGFRFSWQDAVVLTIGGLATWFLWLKLPGFAPALPIVLVHFFLFCNVFRISRRSELIWAACFLVNATVWGLLSESGVTIDWGKLLLAQTPITVFLIWIEMRRTDYHGIGAARNNPIDE